MIEKFKTLFLVKSSLITLYLALTIPLPLIASEKLKIPSIIIFVFGLFLIFSITSDYVEICNKKIAYKVSFISNIFGKNNWEILWTDIKLIKSFPTSQGSKVYYFVTNKDEKILVPQRIDNFERFLSIISCKTKLNVENLSYPSPLWTYKFLTFISLLMVVGELFAFKI
tara:strand:+ start:60 stop:566 length:507 start_codon:yes stop_codon:yes gene_type:complete